MMYVVEMALDGMIHTPRFETIGLCIQKALRFTASTI
jgi:hypothetical protein